MDKLLNIKGNILYNIIFIFISTALLISCKWTSKDSTNIPREPIKSSKSFAERIGKTEETKTDYPDKVQQVEISQTVFNHFENNVWASLSYEIQIVLTFPQISSNFKISNE